MSKRVQTARNMFRKAVRWRMTVPVPDEEPLTLSRTGHLIAQDGKWRWTLSADSFAVLEAGGCP